MHRVGEEHFRKVEEEKESKQRIDILFPSSAMVSSSISCMPPLCSSPPSCHSYSCTGCRRISSSHNFPGPPRSWCASYGPSAPPGGPGARPASEAGLVTVR
eukprot:524378-Hanusia_phi.AAC.18